MLLLLIVIIGLGAKAQDYTKTDLTYGVHPGTITTLDGQVIKGYVINGDNTENQNRCIFYTDYTDSKTKKKYNPADLAGYTIENNNYKSMPYSGNIGFGKAGQHFLYLAKAGAISTYIFWLSGKQIVWQKGNDEPFSNSSMLLSFRKTMMKLVEDDADLAGKIDRKEKGYGLLNLDAIVTEYNTWSQAKK
jgi:hypothetical protein